jgi:hypothetical protein
MAIILKRYGLPDQYLESADIYTTHQGELEHCRVKRFYTCTSKAQYTRGISKQERRQRALHHIDERVREADKNKEETRDEQSLAPRLTASPTVDFTLSDKLPPTDPSSAYHISNETRYKLDLGDWIQQEKNNPSMKVGNNHAD